MLSWDTMLSHAEYSMAIKLEWFGWLWVSVLNSIWIPHRVETISLILTHTYTISRFLFKSDLEKHVALKPNRQEKLHYQFGSTTFARLVIHFKEVPRSDVRVMHNHKWCTVSVYCCYNHCSSPHIHLQTLKGHVICSAGQRISLKLTPASDVGQPVAAKLMSAARYDISLASRASLALWSLACECVLTPWLPCIFQHQRCINDSGGSLGVFSHWRANGQRVYRQAFNQCTHAH